MEHEVFVPVPADRLRQALADPARVARAIPGLQQDAGTDPVAGRLKVRIGGHTITYRGTLRIAARDDGSYLVEGEATEARGTGAMKLSLSLRLRPAEGGTTVVFTGGATGDGRIAELPADAVTSAGTRLLGRSAENLAEAVSSGFGVEEFEEPGKGVSPKAADSTDSMDSTDPTGPKDSTGPTDPTPPASPSAPVPPASPAPPASPSTPSSPSSPSVHDADIPPSSLDPFADDDAGFADDEPGFEGDDEPPAEAAHARRTMIGRSAEEVDHAPPRGRYAPVPAPETATATTLRWAAPAAALLVASAVVAGRLLRRRR
ncbi:SRPBCC family protein [Streptomyces sp. NPDC052036]|uniref:SRPBCC family protein n=1 Tax=Streptomyces sp. NPDC052036 TaxID=3155171 RepID=UPI00343840F9